MSRFVCAACGGPADLLDSGTTLRERDASGKVVLRHVIERVTACPPAPTGCGTVRVQRETRVVEDLGETGKRYIRGRGKAAA